MKSITLSAVLLCASSTASAGGFATARFGAEYGHAATDHPTAMYFNPAGLALTSGTKVYVESLFASRAATYTRPPDAISNVVPSDSTEGGTPRNAADRNSGTARLSNALVSPFVGVQSDFGVPGLGVGLSIYAPFGGQSSWGQAKEFEGDDRHPGALDGPARWSSIDGSISALYVTLAGAYRLPGPRLSFGLGINVVRQALDTVRARTAAGTDDLVAGNTLIEGRTLVEGSSIDLALGAGVIWEPILNKAWLGVSYQSQPGFGETKLSGTLTNQFGTTAPATSSTDLVHSLPDVFRLGARWRPDPRFEVRLSGDYTRWSVMDYQCLADRSDSEANCSFNERGGLASDGAGVVVNVQRNWKDTFGVKGGFSFWVVPEIELMLGGAYDSNAVPDETMDPTFIDTDKFLGTIGLRMKLLESTMSVMATYTQVIYKDRVVPTRQAMADEARVERSEFEFESPSAIPDHGGRYEQNIGFLTIGVGYQF